MADHNDVQDAVTDSTAEALGHAGGPHPGATAPPRLIGKRIGRYHIKRVIASGGMGTVFEALQEQPRRVVALKLMKHGIASRSALRRFEYESQLLARLRHAGIAQVYEAGQHDDGSGAVPYFAMEYVPSAKSLTEYAAEKKLGTRERLELFTKVCDAVHHGHQKGIIHRDLKPGNLLVDSSGGPKVIDFGVARATDSDMAVTTLQTDIGQLIGTLQYMSPEQCDADPHDLDTRSDVYALGVVLYELLCGKLPYDVTKVALHEAARMIRETAPARPSTIDRTLRGDIETITLKAMQKERERRYRSAAELGDDIRRYLCDQPIIARPTSVTYQIRRFIRRNKAVVILAMLLDLVLIGGLLATLLMAQRATSAERSLGLQLRELQAAKTATEDSRKLALDAEAQAKQRADELALVSDFQASQLSGINVALMGASMRGHIIDKRRAELELRGLDVGTITANLQQLEQSLVGVNFTNVALDMLDRNIFDRALQAVDTQFIDQPSVKAKLLQVLATTMRDLGLFDQAMKPQAEALDIRRRVLGDEHYDTLSSMNSMAVLLQSRGQLDRAQLYYQEALEKRRRILGDEHPDTLRSLSNMGLLLLSQGKRDQAELYVREAFDKRRRILGDEHPDNLDMIISMGFLLEQQGKFDQAEAYYREAAEKCRRILGVEHPETLRSINNLAFLLQSQRRLDEAEPYFRQATDTCRRVLGNEHAKTLVSINNLGGLLQQQGKLDQAEPYYREALETRRRILGDDHPDTLRSINNMGGLYLRQGMLVQAEPYYREALKSRRRVLGDEHPDTLTSINNLGALLRQQGKFDEAESMLLPAAEIAMSKLPSQHPVRKGMLMNIAHLYSAWDTAEPHNGHDLEAAQWRAKLEVSTAEKGPSAESAQGEAQAGKPPGSKD